MYRVQWRIQTFGREDLICFSVPYVYFFVRGGKVFSQIGWGTMARFAPPLDSPLPTNDLFHCLLVTFATAYQWPL